MRKQDEGRGKGKAPPLLCNTLFNSLQAPIYYVTNVTPLPLHLPHLLPPNTRMHAPPCAHTCSRQPWTSPLPFTSPARAHVHTHTRARAHTHADSPHVQTDPHGLDRPRLLRTGLEVHYDVEAIPICYGCLKLLSQTRRLGLAYPGGQLRESVSVCVCVCTRVCVRVCAHCVCVCVCVFAMAASNCLRRFADPA